MMNIIQNILVFSFVFGAFALRQYTHRRPYGGFLHRGQNLRSSERGFTRSATDDPVDDPELNIFMQYIDHFNPQSTATFKQRFWKNSTFFDLKRAQNSSGPVFLMLGGEGPESNFFVNNGQMAELGQEFGALLFLVEHRFYGQSQPFADLSTENLQFLTSQQALADFAYFIEVQKQEMGLDEMLNPWIVFGGSYSGAMAAWLRLKYPNLIVAAVAASAPVHAKTNFVEYFEVISQSLGTTPNGTECKERVRNGTAQIEALLKDAKNFPQLMSQFKLCNFTTPEPDDITNMLADLAGNFAGVIQYTFDNRGNSRELTVNWLCDVMLNGSDPVAQLAVINSVLLQSNANGSTSACLDVSYQGMIANLTNSSLASSSAEGGRQWFYQTCTEFGYFQSSDSPAQIFGDGFPGPFWTKQCAEVFNSADVNMSDLSRFPNPTWTNGFYGGQKVTSSNIIFPNGELDPWKALSVQGNVSSSEILLLIKNTSHCAAMYRSSPQDDPALKDARIQIRNQIALWLQPCSPGFFMDGFVATCAACSGVAFCGGDALTCTSRVDSQCSQCAAGYYVLDGQASAPSLCMACDTVCPASTGTNSAGGADCAVDSNRVCGPCPAGTTQAGDALLCAEAATPPDEDHCHGAGSKTTALVVVVVLLSIAVVGLSLLVYKQYRDSAAIKSSTYNELYG